MTQNKRGRWSTLAVVGVVLMFGTVLAAATFEVSSQQIRGMGSNGQLLRGNFAVPPGGATITQCAGAPAGFWITYPNGGVKTFASCNQALGLVLAAGPNYSAYPNLPREQASASLSLTLSTGGGCSLTGSWSAATPEGTMFLSLTQTGARLSGTLKFKASDGTSVDGPIKGAVSGNNVSFEGEDDSSSMTGVIAAGCNSVALTLKGDGETHNITMKRQ
ncbi:MAG: hypothetical protein MUF51_01805 [Vicinamibacteria bacterium]|jgi:hypothetical protein|nr:hypothetical protein [Vicinamibacteria bacterium]